MNDKVTPLFAGTDVPGSKMMQSSHYWRTCWPVLSRGKS